MPWDENADRFSTNGKNLLVEKPGPGGLGPSITLHNSGGGVNASATIDFNTAPDIATPPVSRIQTCNALELIMTLRAHVRGQRRFDRYPISSLSITSRASPSANSCAREGPLSAGEPPRAD